MVEKADRGQIIWQNADFIIRAKIEAHGKLTLFVHTIDDAGNEQLPRGYLSGSNYMACYPLYM